MNSSCFRADAISARQGGRPSQRKLHTCGLLVALCLTWSQAALGSPWVLKKHGMVVGLTAGTQFATSEFLPRERDGKHQAFPLNGRFEAYFLELSGRYGLGRGFEVAAKVEFKGISFSSDPVLIQDGTESISPREANEQTFDFSQRAAGLGDIRLGVAYQHLKRQIRLASTVWVKIPGGYRQPRATFREDQPSPDQINDDVALGDGQVDLQYALEAGTVIRKTRTLFEVDAGYRARFNGPGHQVFGLVKIGQLVGRNVLLFVSLDGAYTIFSGERLGNSFIAKDPDQPKNAFMKDNVEQVPLRLDRDFLILSGGALFRFGGPEWVARVSHTFLGQNFSRITSISLGLLVSFG